MTLPSAETVVGNPEAQSAKVPEDGMPTHVEVVGQVPAGPVVQNPTGATTRSVSPQVTARAPTAPCALLS